MFFYFYFLNVDISLTMYTICLKLMLHTEKIAMEGTMSQIVYTSPHLFFIKCRKNIQKNNQKLPVFLQKIKTRTEKKKSETPFPQHGCWLRIYKVLHSQTHYLLRYGRLRNKSEKMSFCQMVSQFYIYSQNYILH